MLVDKFKKSLYPKRIKKDSDSHKLRVRQREKHPRNIEGAFICLLNKETKKGITNKPFPHKGRDFRGYLKLAHVRF